MIIIGITGTLGAGKGTIVEYMVENKGFNHYSVRGFLLEEIRRLGMPENRDSMYNLANDLRAEHGPSYVTDRLYEKAVQEGKNSVIESIRTTGEGVVNVVVTSSPALADGDRYRLLLNGEIMKEAAGQGNFPLENLNRGTHTLVAEIIDHTGRSLARSEEITFHVLRVANPPRPAPR